MVQKINQNKDIGFDHINGNTPVLVRSPKLTPFELAQYWGGRPPGNSVVLNPFLQWVSDKTFGLELVVFCAARYIF